jgi:hypothetical protein
LQTRSTQLKARIRTSQRIIARQDGSASGSSSPAAPSSTRWRRTRGEREPGGLREALRVPKLADGLAAGGEGERLPPPGSGGLEVMVRRRGEQMRVRVSGRGVAAARTHASCQA